MSLNYREPPPALGRNFRHVPALVWMCPTIEFADALAAWAKETYPESQAKKTYLFAAGVWIVMVIDLSDGGTDAKQTDNS